MLDKNVAIKWSGVDGLVTGNLKYVHEIGELFGEGEQDGHFFPIKFDESLEGQKLDLVGPTTVSSITVDGDHGMIIRIENLDKSKKIVFKKDGEVIIALNFNNAKLDKNVV